MVKGIREYTFSQLAGKIEGARDGEANLGNNTAARFVSGGSRMKIAIKLHRTDIVLLSPDNKYQLFSGGYMTSTTKQRLNNLTPAEIIQKDFGWYVLRNPAGGKGKDNLIEFYDGIKVDMHGQVISR